MRLRNTLLLLLVLVGLGAYVYFVEYPAAQKEAEKEKLVELETEAASSVGLKYPNREIVLKKSDGKWRITEPIEADADETTVESLLRSIADCEVTKTLEGPPGDLAAFGLEEPQAMVTVTVGESTLPEIRVGKKSPVGFSAYVQRGEGGAVLMTSASFQTAVEKEVKDLRDKRVLPIEEETIRRVVLAGENSNIVLAHVDGEWRIEQPRAYAADDTVVQSFLTSLRNMRAVDFPDDSATDLAPYGLDAPRLTLTLALEDGAEQRVLFGRENDDKQVYVKQETKPVIYAVSQWVYRDLNKSLGDLRDKSLLSFAEDDARRIRVTHTDGSELILMRGDDEEWTVEGVEGKPVAYKVTQLVNDVRGLKGFEILADATTDLASFGLDHPKITVSVLGKDEAVLGKAVLGEREGEEGKVYTGMREGGDTIFRVRDYVFERLDKRADDFIEKPTEAAVEEIDDY